MLEARMARKSSVPPPNRRVPKSDNRPENRRTSTPTLRVPLRARLVLWRERLRVRTAGVKRIASVVFAVVASAAAIAGLLACGKLVQRHLRTAPAFAAKTMEVQGASHYTQNDVLRIAGLAVGRNVFEVGPDEARQRLERDPWIESASVARRLPSTFRIEISEQKPVALLALDKLYLVGEDGEAFKPLESGDPADFPIITGIAPEDVQRDKQGSASLLVGAVALLHDYRDAGLLRQQPVSEIHVEQDGSLSLYVGGESTYVRLGKAPFRTKLRRLREVLTELASKRTRAAYVYLDNERRSDRVTVRLR
jgi:cell division protein FtsQ